MILIGQYDSPFVRRVGIALRLYGMPFEHRPWSVVGDFDRLLAINPTGSVPVLVLVLDDGTALVESKVILDNLDSLVPENRRLWPEERLGALRLSGFALQLGDRMVSLFYERRLHAQVSEVLQGRRETQITATLAMLERERAAQSGEWWFGDGLTHADIAVACILRFVQDCLADLYDPERYPALAAHAARAEALPVFQEISQPFIPPA
ncbi:MAG TPA: glutathione S-transferase family protein [Albidovulum sp.]|uniref:glutathione S-transferase family protein n=1 Tax=Albidovulum sp. TaxID=1872424 RepID=UPI002B7B8042|nr:glutathione S-transferase family protein [Albidovulum sp.]